MENRMILVINPGSTSTKIAVYEDSRSVFVKTIRHTIDELRPFDTVADQLNFRKDLVMKELQSEQIDLHQITIIMGRGGMIRPVESGVYEVNDLMKNDLRNGLQGEHASNLGGLIADEIAQILPGAKAYIADPVVVDELQDIARITGLPLFERRSIFHALNQKAVARSYAHSIHRDYEDMNLIVVHLGGGISIGVHLKGRVIDVNQALDGEGPMSPERSGSLPMGDLLKASFSGQYDYKTLQRLINGEGGYVAYFGTNDAYKIEQMANNGDSKALLIQRALGYQVAKYIGASAAVLEGIVDAIILTGGLAHNKTLTEMISKHVSFIAQVLVYPGEDEMKALAMNALLILTGQIVPKEYK